MLGLEEQLAEINREYAVVMVGGKCCILKENCCSLTGKVSITLLTPNDFRHFFANKMVEIDTEKGKKEISVSKAWMESGNRRQYDGIIFDPAGKYLDSKKYNMFQGLPIKPIKGNCSLMLQHILNVICSGNEQHYKYLLCWFARCIQQPGGQRPGVAIVLRGGQGVGKGKAVNPFGELFGAHYLHITSGSQLTGRFNQHLASGILVFSDEGVWGGDKVAEGVLKGLITEGTLFVEPKGKDCYTVDNHVNLIIASNSKWVTPAGMGERRFFVLDVSDCHMQDKVYFKALTDELENGGQEAFMYHLLNEVDVDEVDLRSPPRTAGLFDQQLRTMRSIEKWWYQLLCDGGFPDVVIDEHDKLVVRPGTLGEWPSWYSTEDLHFAYREYARANHDRYADDRMAFTKELIKLCPGLASFRKTSGSNRQSGLSIPVLSECRTAFENLVKSPIEWPSLDILADQRPRDYGLGAYDWTPSDMGARSPKSFSLGEMSTH